MGRDDVIMDNGKKAQSAMARHWKKQKEREKNKQHRPRDSKKPTQDDAEEQVDPSKVSYEKWKHHQMDMQMKKFGTKPGEDGQPDEQPQPNQQQSEEKAPVEQSYDALTKRMDNRELVIPGYGKSSALQKKLNVIEAPKPKVQPKVTGVPDGLKDLFSSEADLQRILMMNKQKKKLKALAKEEERARRSAQATIASVSSDPFEKTLEDEGYNPTKKKQESESEEEQPKTQQKIFKSDVLNKLAEGSKLQQVIAQPQKQPVVVSVQIQKPQADSQTMRKPLFVPRAAVIKKPPAQ